MASLIGWAGELRRHTPPFAGGDPAAQARSIAVMERVDLAGSLQEVWIRGRDTRNPVLLLLHGGPGTSESALFRHFVSELEEHFTVIYWDQRGAGRSWLSAAHPEALGTDQLPRDLDALVDSTTRRFGKKGVVLLGHSWGSALGALYAARHPDRVLHFVGVAQVVNPVEGQRIEQQFVRSQALVHGDRAVLEEVQELGAPPLSVRGLLRQGKLCERYGGVFHARMRTHDLILAALQASETSLLDVALFGLGNRFSLKRLLLEINTLDLFTQVTKLQVPVTLMLGRHDHHVPSELAALWLSRLDAPAKRLVWFDASAHNPPFEEPSRFITEVVRAVGSAP